jgi:hypothetical protein
VEIEFWMEYALGASDRWVVNHGILASRECLGQISWASPPSVPNQAPDETILGYRASIQAQREFPCSLSFSLLGLWEPEYLATTLNYCYRYHPPASLHIHILIAVATAKKASTCDSKIDNLQTLQNHNVHPIHIQAMTLVHESLRLSLVWFEECASCLKKGKEIISSAARL